MSAKLPLKIDGLIPHQPPMLVVDELIFLKADMAISRTVFPADSPFADSSGRIEEAVLVEMMAQTFAAAFFSAGLSDHGPSHGYLVGIKRMNFNGRAQAGTAVEVEVKIISELDDFSVIEGRASQNGSTLASGQLTVFAPQEALV